MIGTMRVEVVPYDPQWPRTFEALRAELSGILGAVDVVGIEHVGSTAVPGLAAKPIIDVDVVVDAGDVRAAIRALERAGYVDRGELGVPDRHALGAPEGGEPRHVYVTVDGCLALRNHLGVREVLRADPDLRDRYGALKTEFVERDFDGIDDYTAAKSDLLQLILERAGFSRDERAAVDEVNRPGR